MAVIKCKMCGGDLNIVENASTAECEYCGSVQTIPKVDDEKKLTLFARANRLRAGCEFDKATGIYEAIVADFPEEAEAYWGLVLCKYGIEYVDDPATGKKIPTCHRSSFDSVMEDSDFEQALENADIVAQKVYREEAKQFERIRKGIIAVSAKEKPYDIFICYKETDEKGDRTLDSVLAQDLYTALTDKGYRVFFSRITLTGILGVDFEPYIFAALNSAKVMLAVGTCYEYYNAVWVKNEWSRYIKICQKDKERYLIPCYKDIDPEDMPKEFKHLQGADLGKMGAIQDILFNMEKYIPLQKETKTVIQEKVVVSGENNKIASLLDRGNMALEDGEWDNADNFFEEVLNNDSKNAQAYLGKALASEKCRTLDGLITRMINTFPCANAEEIPFTEFRQTDAEARSAAMEKYAIPGWLDKNAVADLFNFDLTYKSSVKDREQQRKELEKWWKSHKLLSRAEQFASGNTAQILKDSYNKLMAELNARIEKAKQAETAAINILRENHPERLETAETKAKELHETAAAKREKEYERCCSYLKIEKTAEALDKIARSLRLLGDYKDSKAKYEECQKKIQEIYAADAAAKKAAEDQKRAAAAAYAKRKARKKAVTVTALVATALTVVIFVVMLFTVILPGKKYNEAMQLYDAGRYSEAIQMFTSVPNYKDSVKKIAACAEKLEKSGDRVAAFNGYRKVLSYSEEYQEIIYAYGEAFLAEGDNARAAMCFGTLGNYKDAKTLSTTLWDQVAERETIGARGTAVIGLQNDGSVVTAGRSHSKEFAFTDEVANWSGVIAVAVGDDYALGLKADGTVLVAGGENKLRKAVRKWTDIVAIAGGDSHALGLKADGTVVAAGQTMYGRCDVSGWEDIVKISAGSIHSTGLKADGTVVAVGKNDDGQCDVSEWTDIVAISAYRWHTMALKSDGTIALTGWGYGEAPDVSQLKDIVAIRAGYVHVVLQQSDGKLLVLGDETYGPNSVTEWENVATFAVGDYHTMALLEDGTINCAGQMNFNQSECGHWANIKIPDYIKRNNQSAATDTEEEKQ